MYKVGHPNVNGVRFSSTGAWEQSPIQTSRIVLIFINIIFCHDILISSFFPSSDIYVHLSNIFWLSVIKKIDNTIGGKPLFLNYKILKVFERKKKTNFCKI